MGKANKKVRNDRINAIRKQYDAFLEEDKKRRERNEYILEKLDKMRSSTALVPISTKVNYPMELNASETFIRPNILRTKPEIRDIYVSHIERQNITSGILNKPMDELRILKEISKKYILIPKSITPTQNDYNYSKDVINDDWKSKYNILDELKKQDKENRRQPVFKEYNDENNIHNKRLDLSMESNISDKQPPNLNNDANNFDKPIPDRNNELTTIHKPNIFSAEQGKVNKQVNFMEPEIQSKDSKETKDPLQIVSMATEESIKDDQTQFLHNVTKERNNLQQEDVSEKEKYNSESNEKDFKPINNSYNNAATCEMSNILHPAVYEENSNPSDYNTSRDETNNYITPENPETPADMAHAPISNQSISDIIPQETSNVEYLEEAVVPLDPNIKNQSDVMDIRDFASHESVELCNDIDNNPKGTIEANIDNNPKGSVAVNEPALEKLQHYDPPQNTVPIDLENIQNSEHIEHESEINAFEAEQKEMFYSEQPHDEAYAYNQGEGNTGEYPDGYEQNDYAYYEGVQQEQAYATDLNEHEESTERYDPHYNQQYEGTYENQPLDNTVGYENTNVYEQQFQNENQQFENLASYENQQENAQFYQEENVSNDNKTRENVLPQDDQTYDQHLYAEQSDTHEQIEQQLITEEGYIESSPVATDEFQKENRGEIENVTDTTPEKQPVFDPKLS